MRGVRERLDALGERSRPHWALLLLGASLASATFLLTQLGTGSGERRDGAISVLAFVPDAVVFHPRALLAAKLVFLVSGALWLLQRAIPLASWLAAASFTVAVALFQETSGYVDHVFHATNWVLWVLALWAHFHAAEIRAARREGRMLASRLEPRWVYVLVLFTLGWFYTLAGASKLATAGLDWANGTSLQLWALAWGRDNAIVRWIVESRPLAAALQALTLLFETGALLATPFPAARVVVGAGLVGFHVGQAVVFGWAFHGNALLLALSFLPVRAWLLRRGRPAAPPPA